MPKTMIHEDDFKSILKEVSNQTQWNDYCRNNYTYSEFIAMSIGERKADFEEYVDNESIEDLIEENYWEGIFVEKPTIVDDNLNGVLDD